MLDKIQPELDVIEVGSGGADGGHQAAADEADLRADHSQRCLHHLRIGRDDQAEDLAGLDALEPLHGQAHQFAGEKGADDGGVEFDHADDLGGLNVIPPEKHNRGDDAEKDENGENTDSELAPTLGGRRGDGG